MVRNNGIVLFLIYLLFGIYFINSAFSFIKLPDFFLKIDKWILLVGGLLIVLGAINYFRITRRNRYSSGV